MIKNQPVIKIAGLDAGKFLQGQITCDITALEINQPQFGALCNNKGRVIASFKLYKKNEANQDYYLLHVLPDMIDPVIKILHKYGQFSNITLNIIQEDLPVYNLQQDIQNKIANIDLEHSGLFTPHDLNYHTIPKAISFQKGCYTGQEIIARMEYKATLKKSIHYKKLNAEEFHDAQNTKKIVSYIQTDLGQYEALVLGPI